jgi:hypothetical protein
MTYCFDIDGTICSNTDGDYEKAKPFTEVIEAVNSLFEGGHTIYFYTARGSTTGINWEKKTERQLAKWGVKYHKLFLGKPNADLYVDDKSTNVSDWLESLSEEDHV